MKYISIDLACKASEYISSLTRQLGKGETAKQSLREQAA